MADEPTVVEKCKEEIGEILKKYNCALLADVRIVGGKIMSNVLIAEKKIEEEKQP